MRDADHSLTSGAEVMKTWSFTPMSSIHIFGAILNCRDSITFSSVHITYGLMQRGPTGRSRATSGLRPLIAGPATLFLDSLLVTASSHVFFLRRI